MVTAETLRVLDRKQIAAAGPVAGGAQMVSFTPGANVVGYGETGATKYSILLNGIQQGWAGEATSFTEPGSLGITYDGVPVADAATGLWQSATMPQLAGNDEGLSPPVRIRNRHLIVQDPGPLFQAANAAASYRICPGRRRPPGFRRLAGTRVVSVRQPSERALATDCRFWMDS